ADPLTGHLLHGRVPGIQRSIDPLVVERPQVVMPARVEADFESGIDERAHVARAHAGVGRIRPDERAEAIREAVTLVRWRRLDHRRDLVDGPRARRAEPLPFRRVETALVSRA